MEKRLLVDATLVKLGKKLRIFGFDVEIVFSKNVLEVLRKGKSEKRTIITRNSKLFQKAQEYNIACLLVRSNDLEEQVHELLRIFEFESDRSRCPECNVELQSVSRGKVLERVPLFVFLSHEEFSVCIRCGRIYWKGSHFASLERLFREVRGYEELGRIGKGTPQT